MAGSSFLALLLFQRNTNNLYYFVVSLSFHLFYPKTARSCFGSCVVNPTLPQFGGGGEVWNSTDSNSTESLSSDNWYNLPVTLRNWFTSSSNETENGSLVPSNGPAPECALNTCITCNDEVSAPTFERFAGRSRRRSGLVSTAARPCGSIPKIDHYPCPITKPLAE